MRPPRSSRPALVAVLLALVATIAITASAASAASPPAASKPAKPSKKALDARKRAPIAHAASCYAPMTGDWRNITTTNSMTRVVVDFTCNDVILCDINGHCTGGDSYYAMRPFGKCSPTDCNWGRLRAYDMGDGWIRSIYNFGFKTSHVWLKTYDYYGLTYLRVWVFNDFTAADGRTDYTTDEWMLR